MNWPDDSIAISHIFQNVLGFDGRPIALFEQAAMSASTSTDAAMALGYAARAARRRSSIAMMLEGLRSCSSQA